MTSIVLPISLSTEVRERIEAMAARNQTLASQFVEAVLREALGYDDDVKAAIERGLADVAAGRVVAHDEVKARLQATLAKHDKG